MLLGSRVACPRVREVTGGGSEREGQLLSMAVPRERGRERERGGGGE